MEIPEALPSRIAYFITGHGYGHAVRSSQLINAFPSTTKVIIFTTIDKAFFERELVSDFDYIELELDCGCIQLGALDVDVLATFEHYAAINQARAELLDVTCKHLVEQHAEFVIGDIPPLAFTAAMQLGLPSLAISNFTWDQIYLPYCEEDPRFVDLLSDIRQDYGYASHYAQLYPGIIDHPFTESTDAGLLCRTRARSREFVAEKLRLDENQKWCLIYIGEFGIEGIAWEELKRHHDWQFIGLYPLASAPANYQQIQLGQDLEHSDVLANCDLVLGKLGYGLVSECMHWGRPIAYPTRLKFAEHEALAEAIQLQDLGYALTYDDLINCNLDHALSWSNQINSSAYKRSAISVLIELIAKLKQNDCQIQVQKK